MVSQHLTIDILNHVGADLYARTGEGDSRAVIFNVAAGEDSVVVNNPVVVARIVKPDNTFTITTAELISGPDEPQEFRFYIPEAASQVSGIGSYDIRIQEDGEENIVYSAQGRFICDDNMLTDEMIESVAEVDGLIFPDDFATTENMEEIVEEVARELGFAEIDDNVTSDEKTWSSDKISGEIADGIADVIDDNSTSTGKTWSSDKIADEIADVIDDNSTSTGTTWSSDKIANEISSAGGSISYSTTEHVIGTWIDGSAVYERTINVGSFSISSSGVHTIESSTGISKLICANGYIVESGIQYQFPEPTIRIMLNSGNLVFKGVDAGWDVSGGYITIRYTKII